MRKTTTERDADGDTVEVCRWAEFVSVESLHRPSWPSDEMQGVDVWLTPHQARRIADALNQTADLIEANP